MSATDELRRMLDERGVEYEVRVENITDIEHIIWHPNKFSQWDWNEEFGVGWLNGWQSGVTPEQAIAATLGWIDEPDTIRNELADGGLIADVLAPVCVDEKERRAFERGRVHERFAQQIFKEAGMRGDAE